MKSATKLLKNTLLLAASTVLMRLCALCFQAYLASKVGAAELGIFGIISSVGVVFATISISGVRFSVTRLTSEAISCGNNYPRSLMKRAFLYACVFGFLSGVGLFLGADALSKYWVMNKNASRALRLMALSMPLISFGAAAEGYFTAKQKIFRLVCTEFIAQLSRIVFVVFCFNRLKGVELDVSTVLAGGSLVGECVLSLGVLFLYFAEIWRKKEQKIQKGISLRLVKIAFPLAVSAYMRTGLSSMGQIIIPSGLRKSGMGREVAFSTYGIITQMALPVIMFPAALLNALGEILVPRLTHSQVLNQKISISYIVNRALRIGIIFSFGIFGIMFFYSDLLGETIYKNPEAGMYIKIFSFLVPIIYVDCVTDGCLKGLDQQLHSMIYNVMEGVLNVLLLLLLLPKMAIGGYIIVMYVKEIFNAVLSLMRLNRVTSLDKDLSVIVGVMVAVCGAHIFSDIVAPGAGLVARLLIYCVFYVSLLYIINAVTRDDIKWAAMLLNPKKI